MTFSANVKKELCSLPITDSELLAPELYAMLCVSSHLSNGSVVFKSEHRLVADRCIDLVVELCTPILTLSTSYNAKRKKMNYIVSVENPAELKTVREFEENFSFSSIDTANKQAAFLRGSFLSCGSMSNPDKRYHLEFSSANEENAKQLESILSSLSIPVKSIIRHHHRILYLKESESIEDLLTLMGATHASLSVMGSKMIKSVRNNVNRTTNCETANLDKTVAASTKQKEDIRIIKKYMDLSSLPLPLYEAAMARQKHPDLSLRELCEAMPVKVSRSGLNHRFERLHKLAENLKKEHKN